MTMQISFRQAVPNDCSHLAILADSATRRLVSHMWEASAQVGQSPFEVGHEAIRTNAGHFSHYTNWHVAETEGRVAGALGSYLLPPATAVTPGVVRPLDELKTVAAGTWYISVAAVFPEFRGRGIGQALLAKGEEIAHARGLRRLTLMVGSFNEGARRLYQRFGFVEWERRAFVPFANSDPQGEWILMFKDI